MSAPRVDGDGEALPPSALARRGSSRWHHPGERVHALLFSDDGRTLFAGSPEGLTAFDLATGLPRWSHLETASVSLALHAGGSCLLSVGYGGAAHRFDPATGAWQGRIPLGAKKAHNLYSVAASRDGAALAVVGLGPFAWLLHPDGTPRLALQTAPSDHLFHDALFSPDGASVLVMRYGTVARVWSTADGSLRCALAADDPRCACFSPDGASVYLGLGDGDVARHDAASGAELARWKAHAGAVQQLAISADGARLFSLGEADALTRWALASHTAVASLALPGAASAFALSPDGRTVATSHLGRIVLASADDLRELAPRRPDELARPWLAASRDGRILAVCAADRVAWCSPDTLAEEGFDALGDVASLFGLRVLPDGDGRAFKRSDGRGWQRLDLADRAVSTFDAEGDDHWWGARAEAWTTHKTLTLRNAEGATHGLRGPAWSVAFTPDDALAFVLLTDRLLAWDLRRHAEAWSARVPRAWSLWVSPGGDEVLAESGRRVWRFSSDGRRSTTAALPDASGTPLVAYAPDGRHLALGGCNRVEIVDRATDRAAARLDGHRGELTGLCFSADGTRLYTASRDTTVIAWSLAEALAAGPARRDFTATPKPTPPRRTQSTRR